MSDPSYHNPSVATKKAKTYKDSIELARALNEARVPSDYVFGSAIQSFWDEGLRTWGTSIGCRNYLDGKVMLAHDGERWHTVYAVKGGVWVDILGFSSWHAVKTDNGKSVPEWIADKKAVYDHLPDPDKKKDEPMTEKVKIELYSMSAGVDVVIDQPFSSRVHYNALYRAIQGMTATFKERGYESFDFNDLHWDGSFFVGEVTKKVEPDPLDGLTYAGIPIKGMSADDLASALTSKGWKGDGLPLAATIPITANGQLWRVQIAYDEDGDTNVWVHNGTEWVGAYYTIGSWTGWVSGPLSLSKKPPVEQVVTNDYLKQFEPADG